MRHACTNRPRRPSRWTPLSASTSSSRKRNSTANHPSRPTAGQPGRQQTASMDIFDALLQSHQEQRAIAKRLLSDIGDPAQRAKDFEQLKTELAAHETAEERAFYVPLFDYDEAVEASRHGIAEHHEMDEMVECLEKVEAGSAEWLEQLGKLVHKLEHHLKEEEEK